MAAEAEAFCREQLAAERAEGGDRAWNTLVALGALANNLWEQGKLAEAEPLYRELLVANRESGDTRNTMEAAGNLGNMLIARGKLAEAKPLLVEVAAFFQKEWGSGGWAKVSLVELLRGQGRLAEAEQELGTLVADTRKVCGPQHHNYCHTLEAEAVAARLKHAQPDGAAAGAAELRAVVERMREVEHPFTTKWQRVLEGKIFKDMILSKYNNIHICDQNMTNMRMTRSF